MAQPAFVPVRIDQALRDEAAAVLAEMGLTISDVVRIALTKIEKEKALPFDIRVPNTLTAQTLAACRANEANLATGYLLLLPPLMPIRGVALWF